MSNIIDITRQLESDSKYRRLWLEAEAEYRKFLLKHLNKHTDDETVAIVWLMAVKAVLELAAFFDIGKNDLINSPRPIDHQARAGYVYCMQGFIATLEGAVDDVKKSLDGLAKAEKNNG